MAKNDINWTRVTDADSLSPGAVMEFEQGDSDLLVYRLPNGELRAIEAWCPHMKNYMPSGLAPGRTLSDLLDGDEIVCPFHEWRFDGRGHCSGLPPAQRTPPRVARGERIMRSWEIRESGGVIQIGSERPAGPDPVGDHSSG